MSGRCMRAVSVGLACLAMASVICCSSTVGSSHNITCLESERHALLQFPQGLVDESDALASWRSERDCCKWRGISCNPQTGHVTGLDLSFGRQPFSDFVYTGFSLSGEIGHSLIELRYPDYLDLSFNDIGGGMMIPKFIGSLSQLKELKLAYNNFSGPVPPQLGNLSNLQTLDLSWNHVSSENLEWLSHLSFLRYLNMSIVDLSKVVNWSISLSKLTSLTELVLSSCQLPDVNLRSLPSINSSTSLQLLNLSGNFLNSSIFYWIANASTNLVQLDLSENSLEGPIPDFITNMISLATLDLSGNYLSGRLPKSFENSCSLESLDLSANNFSGNIEESLKSLSCANPLTQ